MIDRNLFKLDNFLDIFLDDCAGNISAWRSRCEIVETPEPEKCDKSWRVRCGQSSYLRDLGRGEYIWDIFYGHDSEFYSPEAALIALSEAPVPPWLVMPEEKP